MKRVLLALAVASVLPMPSQAQDPAKLAAYCKIGRAHV